jgi:fructose-1,6-bisphosphatase I/sedoheptulose-1,7-bisphosphatase/fructose-1,6-bisphosphatase I
MTDPRPTLARFVVEEQRRSPGSTGDLGPLLADLSTAFKSVAALLGKGAIAGVLGDAGGSNAQGEAQKKLDLLANELVLSSCEWSGQLAGIVSEELEAPHAIPVGYPRGDHLLVVDPLDGSSNLDVNAPVGTIFSVLRRAEAGPEVGAREFLQHGLRQVCAGYAIYGPSTMVVLTFGAGVHGFTLDRGTGEFFLTHPDLRIPTDTREFAINASNQRFWEPPVKRYVSECLAGRSGPRGVDFNMRWTASLVAEVHRILVRGGVFMYPRDTKQPARPGRLRLLYEASPMALIVEAAGGAASTGDLRILEVEPTELHQRVPLVLGSRDEVERIVRYHREHEEGIGEPFTSPLFAERSLFLY